MTFISEEQYLGQRFYIVDEYTGERKCDILAKNYKKFSQITNQQDITLILDWVLSVLGKSFIAVICQAYIYYIECML